MEKMASSSSSSTSSDPEVASQPQPPSPSLFKIFLPDHNSHLLPIPKHFIQNFDGGIVLKKMLLQNSEGKFWMVELENIQGRLVMNEGWHEFVKAHNLKLGNWLLFKYNGCFVFNVEIFRSDGCLDTSTCRTFKMTSSQSPVKEKTVKFTKALSKRLDYIKLPIHVVRKLNIKPHDETVLRTKKRGEACRVKFDQKSRSLYIGGGELQKFLEKINVEPGYRCEFRVHVASDGKVKEIVIVNISRFVDVDM